MKSDFFEFIGNAGKRRSEKFRVQLWIFLVCLALSIFFWGLVRLSKEYYYSVDYRLNFINTPSYLRLVACSDTTITLKMKIQGFDFFSEHFLLQKDHEVDVSLRNARVQVRGDYATGYLLTSRIGREIVTQSSYPSDVYYVTPDTLFFEFDRLALRKMAPRASAIDIRLQTGQPDSIIIRKDTLRRFSIPGSISKTGNN